MELSDNITLLRKNKSLSQADLGKMIGNSGDVIGRYERGNIFPSIDVVEKIAVAVDVSIDYLIGKNKMVIDKETVEILEDISKLSEDKKNYLCNIINMCVRGFKTRKSLSK